jgi:PAS domain-containing protein
VATTTTTANAPLGLDALPFYTISPRTPPAVITVRPSPPPAAATSAFTAQAIAPKPSPAPPAPKPTAAAHSSNSALFSSALDMVSDELRRTREENEKLRAKLRKTKAKLKRKKAEAKQLRRALAQEIDDRGARRRQELAVVAASATTPRIMATPASMHASWSTLSSDPSSTVSPHSSHSSPSSASTSGSGSGSGSFVSSPLPVSSYSTSHAFPIAVMEHVHQCLPFLSAYLFSPRDFVVQDLRYAVITTTHAHGTHDTHHRTHAFADVRLECRHPMLAFDMGNVMDPTIIYANPALCQLLGFSPVRTRRTKERREATRYDALTGLSSFPRGPAFRS